MAEVSLDNLGSCLNCLVSIETAEDDVFQGRVEKVIEDISTLVLNRPFKTGRPMTSEKYPIFIKPGDCVKIIEPPPQVNSSSVRASSPLARKKSASTQKPTPKPKETVEKKITLMKRNDDVPTSFQQQTPKVAAVSEGSFSQSALQMVPVSVLKQAKPRADQRKSPSDELKALCNIAVKPRLNALRHSDLEPQSSDVKIINSPRTISPVAMLLKAQVPVKLGNALFQLPPPSTQQQQTQFSAANNTTNGPSGNPIMDLVNGYAKYGTHEFNQPINLDELKEDFDFTGNLALFQKDNASENGPNSESDNEIPAIQSASDSGDCYNVVYEDRTAPNFRHDENIISDPKRVTSWVNKATTTKTKQAAQPVVFTATTAKKPNLVATVSTKSRPAEETTGNNGAVDEYTGLKLLAKHAVPTDNGASLPLLRKPDKETLLAATARFYSEQMYGFIVADRFADYVFDLQKRFYISPKNMVLIAGPTCDPVLLHRFAQYFFNRGSKLHIYDPPALPGTLLSKVNVVRTVDSLPTKTPAIYLMCAKTFHADNEVRNWILRLTRPQQQPNANSAAPAKPAIKFPRIVALEFRIFDVRYMHTLYLGAVDESAVRAGRMRENAEGPPTGSMMFEAAVADLGTPYSWISCPEASPADAFRCSLLCRLAIT